MKNGMVKLDSDKKDAKDAPVERLVMTEQDISLAMAKSEAEDHRRAATRMADALQLIYNDVGEVNEVGAGYKAVEYDVSNYKGLNEES